ncbi:MAG: hypothetical protein GEU28_07080 [Dehalococcoidia bacterium]|nr:hypothetical protein [Dehalococcoidia bacterium]
MAVGTTSDDRYVRPVRGFRLRDFPSSMARLFERHELVWFLTVRHFKALYKQSALGYAWTVVNPLAQLIILSFVFSTILRQESQFGVPFAIFLFIGLLPWLFFSSAISFATESVASGMSLITKVYFPREILPITAVITKLIDFLVGVVILIGVTLVYGVGMSWAALWVLPVFFLQFLFTVGLAMPLAALNLFFRDVRFLVGVTLHMLFFLTPIFYAASRVPERYQFLYEFNPNAAFINAYRGAYLGGQAPSIERLALAAAIAVTTFIVGYYIFKKLESGFADRI